jgi:hypothetical protein
MWVACLNIVSADDRARGNIHAVQLQHALSRIRQRVDHDVLQDVVVAQARRRTVVIVGKRCIENPDGQRDGGRARTALGP